MGPSPDLLWNLNFHFNKIMGDFYIYESLRSTDEMIFLYPLVLMKQTTLWEVLREPGILWTTW